MKKNKGLDPLTIRQYRDSMRSLGTAYLQNEEDERTDEYARFYFVGRHEGKEVIYDTVMYTLRLQHESELFEIAERRAAKHFPEYRRITHEEDENGNEAALDPLQEEIGLYIAEVIMELEEEGAVKVKEHVDLDTNTDFGVALDVGLHREKITAADIEKFVRDFNDDNLKLDDNLYSFQSQDLEQ